MNKTSKKSEKKQEGKALGLSFRYCLLHDRLYSREMEGPIPYLYPVPMFLAYLLLDFTLRFTYRSGGIVGVKYLPAALFTLGWALVLSGLVFLLPLKGKRLSRGIPLGVFVGLAVTHSGFMSMFGRFFSFSAMTFGGTGSFFTAEYFRFDWKVITASVVAVLLLLLAGHMLNAAPPNLLSVSPHI